MRIFVSYRRQDSKHPAGRLASRLSARFGAGKVFFDVASIKPGTEYDAQITQALDRCEVLLAVIGPGWLDAQSEDGRRRLDGDVDLMRDEIVAGLDRGIPVVPVLVDGAPEPRAENLPEQLKALAKRQAFGLSDSSFDADADRLIASLSTGRRRVAIIAGAAGIAGVAVAVAVAATFNAAPSRPSPSPTLVASPPTSAAQDTSQNTAPSTAGCNYKANGTSILAPTVTAAGTQSGLTFCPVRINDGTLPITGPFDLDGRILGPQGARQEILLVNYGDQKTCDAFGAAPARGAFLSNDVNMGSADGSWSHTDTLGYAEAVTIARHYEFLTASPASLEVLKNDRQIWKDAHLGNDDAYPGIVSPPPDVKVLATFLVPAGKFAAAAPCK